MKKILQIVNSGNGYNVPHRIYGLGDDNKIYRWDDSEATWKLDQEYEDKVEISSIPS